MKDGPNSITQTYDFLKWSIPTLKKFPRDQRFLLGDRIESCLLDILELLVSAAYSRKKVDLLRDANLKLEIVRFLWRLSFDLHYLDLRRYEYVSTGVNEIGRYIGGWIKHEMGKHEADG